jgi:tight adherence protein C
MTLYILIFLFFLSLVFLFTTIASQRVDDVEARLRQIGYTSDGKILSQEEAELEKPFKERVIKPLTEKIAQIIAKRTPSATKAAIKKKLLQAGETKTVNDFLAMKGFTAIGMPAALGLLFILGKAPLKNAIPIVIFAMVFGYILPDFQLKSKIAKRQKEIQKSLPDVLDLLTVSIEAGLGFDQAVGKLIEKMSGPITKEFSRMIQEVQMNKPRKEALRDMAERVDLPDLSSFVAALIQADQLGVSIANVLRIQSEQMRLKRRQRAEEQAQKASLKMLFPLIFFIFPAMFIVLLGPAVIQVIESMKGMK